MKTKSVLMIRLNGLYRPEDLEKIRNNIKAQIEEGVLVLQGYLSAEMAVIPEDAEIFIWNKETGEAVRIK